MKFFHTIATTPIALLLSAGAQAQGLPVIDAQSILQQIQQVNALVEQLAQLKSQLQQLEQTYSSITGNRGMGTILNSPASQLARRYLPPDLTSLANLATVPNAGYSALQSRIQTLTSQVSTLPPAYFPAGSAAAIQLQSNVERLATNQATAEAAYAAAASHIPDLEAMIAATGTTQDTKGVGEIQARIEAEQALIAAEQNRLAVLLYQQRAEEAVQRQLEDDALRQAGRRSHPPVSF